jgi:orotate phosphoribosyltransferase
MVIAVSAPGPDLNIGAEMARLLFDAQAIQVRQDGAFVLAAGWASPVYVDCRKLIGDPTIRRRAIALMLTYLQAEFGTNLPFEKIVGAETAGIPWAAWLADELDLPLLYVRKRPLGIGRDAQVEGGTVAGGRVLLVDDLATDNSSKLAFARGLRNAGAELRNILVLFHNRAFPGGAERLADNSLTLHALANWNDVLAYDAATPRLLTADRDLIEVFLADPALWSAEHMGRSVRSPPTR